MIFFQVKNKAPAPVQITAEQLLREAKERQLELVPAVSRHFNLFLQVLPYSFVIINKFNLKNFVGYLITFWLSFVSVLSEY